MTQDQATRVGGPYFEELERGRLFDDAPGVTVTAGHTALHQAIAGDRLRLALDAPLCRAVTGEGSLLVHPNLVCDLAIGQSTGPTQRVLGNLFYRGLVLRRPVYIGETLRTTTEVVALKQNSRKPDTAATGLAALRIRTVKEDGAPVLDFWRCAMLPLGNPNLDTGHADTFDDIPEELDREQLERALPAWNLGLLRDNAPGPHHDELAAGDSFSVEGGESVTGATELARLTGNIAMAHTDPTSGARGQRLVYGGHTISVAAAHATRALPALATIVAWAGVDHLAPVFEGDVLHTDLHVEELHSLDQDGALADLRAHVTATRGGAGEPEPVLDWRFMGLVA